MAFSPRTRKIILLVLMLLVSMTLIGFVIWFFVFFSSGGFGDDQGSNLEPGAMMEIESTITPQAHGGLLEEESDFHSAPLEPTPVDFEPVPATEGFLIKGLPTRIEQGVATSFEVVPVDGDWRGVSFDGTVRFESLDPDAVLPETYDFSQSEGETVVFDSAVVFESLGVQSLKVISVDDETVQGEALVAVVPTKKPIEILLPQPGEVADLQLVIRGETEQGIDRVDIYDGGRRIGQGVEVNGNGQFMFVTGFLVPGTHKFRIVSADDDAVSSDVVEVKVTR